MRFKRAMAASMAAVMAVSSAVVCQITASAAGVSVAVDKEIASWGNATINLAAEGTPATGATVTITLDSAVTEPNGWDGQTVFKILSADWSTTYVEESIDGNQTSKTSFTYSIDDDFKGASSILIQAGISAIKVSVSVSEVVADNREEASAVYDGSPITMEKSHPDWAGEDGAAQANFPLTIDLGGAKTYGEIKAKYKNLVVDGINYVKDNIGGSASDYTYCLYAKWGDGTIWSASGSDSLNSKVKWGVDGIASEKITDSTVLAEFGIQINVSKMSDDVKALKDGETFIINPAATIDVASVTIDKTAVKSAYNIGDTVTLTATVDPSDATDPTVTWTSSDNTVATVDKDGKVTAVGIGKATITAAAGDKTDTVDINVEKKKVSATIVADAVTDATVTDAQSLAEEAAKATEIAGLTKDTDYTVKVKADGKKYTVTVALTEEGEKKYELTGDTSKEGTISYKVTGIKLSRDTLSILISNTDGVQLTATIQPEDLAEGEIEWTTADNTVATVENGLVKPVSGSAGNKTTITATVKGTDIKATCEVEIAEVVNPAVKVVLDKTELSGTVGDKAELTATITAEDTTKACTDAVTWTSSNEKVATVNAGTVTFVGEGTATITVTVGNQTATCTVTAKAKVIAVEKVTLDKTTATLTVGDTATLKATVTPDNATDKTVTWTSSDETVATVKDGVVTAVKAGTATITAKAGEKTATCTVTVKDKTVAVENVTLDKTSAELTVGDTTTIKATVTPDNATVKTVTWTSSDETVATVKDGVVTAVKAGTATITAKAGDKTATCAVTVKAKAGDVFSGKADIKPTDLKSWSDNVQIGATSVQEKSVIRIKYSIIDGEQHQIKVQDGAEWKALTSIETNEWGVTEVSKDGVLTITLNKADAEAIAKGGLAITGIGVRIEDVDFNVVADSKKYGTGTETKTEFVRTTINADGTRNMLAVFSISAEDAKNYEAFLVTVKRGSDAKVFKDVVETFYDTVDYTIDGVMYEGTSENGKHLIVLNLVNADPNWGTITVNIEPTEVKG